MSGNRGSDRPPVPVISVPARTRPAVVSTTHSCASSSHAAAVSVVSKLVRAPMPWAAATWRR